MSPIKELSLTYEALNAAGTFSEGDILTGTVSVTLSKEVKVKKLFVKAKGDANVRWTEGSGDNERSYSAHRRYFKVKEWLVAENGKGTVLPQGVHLFKFKLQIPQGDMPSSFVGLHGRIVYMLEAKLCRGWRFPSKVHKVINFVSRSLQQSERVMCQQHGSVSKEVGVFSKKAVEMSATMDRKFCSPGDTLSVVAKIHNSSSKKVTPKFSLQQKTVYRASGSTNTCDKSLLKMSGNPIPPCSEETVSCQLKIPADASYSLQNCEIVSVSYYLKVYLDISFAFDPEVVFPLIILPSSFANFQVGGAVGPYPVEVFGCPSYSDFPPPAFPVGPYPVPAGSGAYGCPAQFPIQHPNITCGFNYQWPQQTAPYNLPPASFSSSSMQQPAPTVPPLFPQGEGPPSYMAPFPPSHNTHKS
ncbi:arrestin domain-containing protein 3-like [Toxotes jaculatrix]|uniref:arrestin domain-containing protein 3-like n=1 Tax=Toxotes jaculatrix TaxID=941984 RepID=UPI001B3AFB6B|nr:arrestin domain-containing protein 3-like [Toxotes jaculatrix]